VKSRKIKIYGRVQGVFFRANTKKFCDMIKICGRVRNCSDGSVEIVVQCDKERLEILEKWLKNSHGLSKVEKVEGEEVEVGEKFEDFRIVSSGNLIVDKGKAARNLSKRLLRY